MRILYQHTAFHIYLRAKLDCLPIPHQEMEWSDVGPLEYSDRKVLIHYHSIVDEAHIVASMANDLIYLTDHFVRSSVKT